MKTLPRKTMAALLFGLIVFGIGQTVLFAMLGPVARDIGLDVVDVGLIVTVSALVVVLVSPAWGRVADRWGRTRTLTLGLGGYAVTTLLFAWVLHLGLEGEISPYWSFGLLLGSRVLYALVAAAIQPSASAIVASGTDAANRSSGMALVGMGFVLGTILGPLVGAAFIGWSLLAPLFVTVALAVLAAFAAAFLVEEPTWERADDGVALKASDPRLRSTLLLAALAFVTIAITQQTLSFFVQDLLGLDAAAATRKVGLALAAFALAALATQILLVRRYTPSPRTLLQGGAALLLAGFVALSLAGHLAVVVGGCLALGVGYGLAMPGFQSSASLAVGPAEQGAAAGLVSAAMALGFVIGPILGTSLYYAEHRLPFIAAAALCLGLLGAVTAMRQTTPAEGAR
ncbi:MFS transporter [Methylorubrum zatmanii]